MLICSLTLWPWPSSGPLCFLLPCGPLLQPWQGTVFLTETQEAALPVASGSRKQSQREVGTRVENHLGWWVGGCGMVAMSDSQGASYQHLVRECPTWAWSASRMPRCQSRANCTGVREACEQRPRVILSPLSANCTSAQTLPGWHSPHSSCPAWLHRAAAASLLCGARNALPRGVLCPLPVGGRAGSHCYGPNAGTSR